MAKRKSSEDDNFEAKLQRVEENVDTDQSSFVEGKNKRVRKKSAKLLEMEEYEVFEKKILKTSTKSSAAANNTKSATSKIKQKVSVVKTPTAEKSPAKEKPQSVKKVPFSEKTQPVENTVPVAGLPETKKIINMSEVEAVAPNDNHVPDLTSSNTLPVSFPTAAATSLESLKVSPIKLKNLNMLSNSVSKNKIEIVSSKSMKVPKPKQSFEDQLIGADQAVVLKPKVKKSKKMKTEVKNVENSESQKNVDSKLDLKYDDADLRTNICLKSAKTELTDSDMKSDEEQPAYWPSEIQEENDGRVLVKLKKKKNKKNKMDIDGRFDFLNKRPMNGTTASANDISEAILQSDGRLEIDLSPKKSSFHQNNHNSFLAKKKKKKIMHDHSKMGDSSKTMNSETINVESGTEAILSQQNGTDVHPVGLYSNTEIMALKLKTSSEKKASTSVLRNKEKRFRRRGPTAYTMFSNDYRMKVLAENPGIDFASISKRLGEIWQCLPAKEKMLWKRKAKQRVNKILKVTSSKKTDDISDMIFTCKVPSTFRKAGISSLAKSTVKKSNVKTFTQKHSTKILKVDPEADEQLSSTLLGQLLTSQIPKQSSSNVSASRSIHHKADDTVPCKPINVAAHLKLLGDSLQTIGFKLQDHRGPIAVQGSLSVLLDSAMCAMGSLMCLTNQLPEMKSILNKTHSKNLDNIAHIMPGIG